MNGSKEGKGITARLMAALLTAALIVAPVSGCAKAPADPSAAPTDTPEAGKPVPGIYTAEQIAIIETDIDSNSEITINYTAVGEVAYANGRVYYSLSKQGTRTDESGAEIVESETSIVSTNLDGTDSAIIWGPVYASYDSGSSYIEQLYLSSFEVDAEGNIWIMYNHSIYDTTDPFNMVSESTDKIEKLAADGTEASSIDVQTIPGYDSNSDYVQDFILDGAGNVYIRMIGNGSNYKVAVFSGETGEYLFTVNETGYLTGIARFASGEIGYFVVDARTGSGQTLKVIDFAAKSSAEKPFTGRASVGDIYSGFGEYDFLYFVSGTLYGYKLEEQTAEPVVLFFDSGIPVDWIQGIATTEDGGIVISAASYSGRTNVGLELQLLTPNLDPSIGQKKVITLGGVYLDSNARDAAFAFNKASADARITFQDYSEYNTQDDYSRGAAQLDLDILGARAPDIISLTNLSTRKYASKGVFADLYPLMDADETLGREDLFENILRMTEYNGKLTSIIPSFTMITAAGKKSIFGDKTSITPAQLREIADKNPDSKIFDNMNVDDWMSYVTMLTLDDFVNWETGVCSFNTPEFIELLELAKRFPKDNPTDRSAITSYEEYISLQEAAGEALKNGKTLLALQYVYNPGVLRDARNIFGGEDVTLIGFPTTGSSGTVVMPNGAYAISESSQFKQEAWSFISYLLQKTESADYTLKANKAVFEKWAADEMTPLKDRDYSTPVMIMMTLQGGMTTGISARSYAELERTAMFTAEQLDNYHLSQEEVDAARAVIEGAEKASSYSTNKISEIISEEIGAFISSSKSAEETAAVIQSRVQIFVSEGM
jgi:ABC-type glycerol-3-phosphate transport system substrate-binding protein